MAEMGPLSKSEMPGFNIMGLLLGGRGYAANWFSERDRLQLEQAQQAERQTFAKGVLASPELARANAAPYDRNAQFGLWGQMFGGPGTAEGLGNQLLTDSIRGIYGREATTYDDALQRARIKMTADESLRVDEVKRARDAQQRKEMIGAVFGPDGQTAAQQMMRNQAFDGMGGKRPEGMDVIPGPDGNLVFRPAFGGPEWQKMMEDIQPKQSVLSGLKSLQAMAESGQGDKAAWDTERQLLQLNIQRANKLGSLDQGTMDFLNEMIPSYRAGPTEPSKWGEQKERLRVLVSRVEGDLQAAGNKWMVPVNSIPDTYKGRGWQGSPDMSTLPKTPARAGVDAARKAAKDNAGQSPRAQATRAGEAGAAIGGMVPQGEPAPGRYNQGRGAGRGSNRIW